MKMKDKIIVCLFLIVSSVFFTYLMWNLIAKTSIWFFKKEATAHVIDLVHESDKYLITYKYSDNSYDYTIEKAISVEVFGRLKNRNEVRIHYSTIFPDNSVLEGVKDFSFIYFLLGSLISGFAVYRSIQAIRGKISLSDLM